MAGGAGAGHIFDMIARLKANKSLLKRKRYFQTKAIYLKASGGKKISFRECPPEVLEKIRKDFKKEAKKRTLKTIFSLSTAVLITIGIIWLIKWVIMTFYF